MFGFGGRTSKRYSPIGIAVTAREVYLAQRGPRGEVVFATQRLAEGTDPAGPSYHAETSSAIASALRQAKFTSKQAVSALPVESLRHKTLRLPPMPEEDLVQAVAWEAAERFQIGDDQLLQHYSAGEVHQGSEKRQEIILLSAERATVHDHASAVKRAGLMPIAIDASGAALARLLGVDQQSVLIIHLGEAAAEIVAARGSQVLFDKPIDLTKLNDQMDSAALVRELGLCLRYLSVTFGIHQPDATWISGQGATLELATELTELMPTSIQHVMHAPALRDINFPNALDPSPWLVPLGLALRDESQTAQRGAA